MRSTWLIGLLAVITLLIIPFAQSVSVYENLTFSINFEEGAGSTATEDDGIGGHKNVLTLTSGVTWVPSLGAHGTGDYALMNPTIAYGAEDTDQTDTKYLIDHSWTFAAWIYLNSSTVSKTYVIMSKGTGADSTLDYQWRVERLDTNGHLKMFNYGGATAQDTGSAIPFKTWIHVTAVVDVDQDRVIFYQNGTKTSNISMTAATNLQTTSFKVMCRGSGDPCSTTNWYEGAIDNVQVWKRALNTPEVLQVYENGTPARAIDMNITSPINNSVTNIPYINGTAYATFGVNNVTIDIAGTVLSWNKTGSTNTFISWGFGGLSDGTHVATVTMNDSQGYVTQSVNFTLDTISPDITVTLPINGSILDKSFDTLNVSASCTDLNPFKFNLTITNQSNKVEYSEQDNTVSSPQSIISQIDISDYAVGTYNLNWTCTDSHTKNHISDYVVERQGERITFRDGSTDIAITLQGKPVSHDLEPSYTKKIDRYEFTFGTGKDQRGSYSFIVTSNKELIPITGSGYKAHFVTGQNWLDFENDDPNAQYSIQRIRYNQYRVIVTTDDLHFRSVGGLNYFSEYNNIDIIETTEINTTLVSPQNGSTLSSTDINYTFNTTHASFCTLYINNTKNGTSSSGLGQGSILGSASDGSYRWNVECVEQGIGGNSSFFIFTVDTAVPSSTSTTNASSTGYSYDTCPNATTPQVLLFIFMFVVAFMIIVIAAALHIGFLGLFGGIGISIMGAYFMACILPLSIFTILAGVLIMVHFFTNNRYW